MLLCGSCIHLLWQRESWAWKLGCQSMFLSSPMVTRCRSDQINEATVTSGWNELPPMVSRLSFVQSTASSLGGLSIWLGCLLGTSQMRCSRHVWWRGCPRADQGHPAEISWLPWSLYRRTKEGGQGEGVLGICTAPTWPDLDLLGVCMGRWMVSSEGS